MKRWPATAWTWRANIIKTATVIASSIYLPHGQRHKREQNERRLNTRIGFCKGSLALFADERPKRKAPAEPKVECANDAAVFMCMRWELQDKLDALIKATKQPGSESVYQQLRILKSHVGDTLERFGPEVSDKSVRLSGAK